MIKLRRLWRNDHLITTIDIRTFYQLDSMIKDALERRKDFDYRRDWVEDEKLPATLKPDYEYYKGL